MASNSFGNIFRITTWGESHGKAIGVVIDGCPAGIELDITDIQQELMRRSPGGNIYVSPRKEPDDAQILSGVFAGRTTGSPISIIINNIDQDSSKYEPIKNLLRPGHANYTYLKKYGVFDYRGGGRASARETACRVAAAAVAKKLLNIYQIKVIAYLRQVGDMVNSVEYLDFAKLQQSAIPENLFTPSQDILNKIADKILSAKEQGDSIGGIVEFQGFNIPAGLGDPIYQKMEANLAYAMLSIPATRGFEIGSGFLGTTMYGSQHNDEFICGADKICASNNSGGVLAGITTGMNLSGRVAFKPASSIAKAQNTCDLNGNKQILELPIGSRHDPCVAVRAVPVVEAMLSLVLADSLLLNLSAKING